VIFTDVWQEGGSRPVKTNSQDVPQAPAYKEDDDQTYDNQTVYTGTDDNGTLIFSDDPSKVRNNKQMKSQPSTRSSSDNGKDNSRPFNTPSKQYSTACFKEYDTANKKCASASASKKIKNNLSPECHKEITLSRKSKLSASCERELQTAGLEILQCLQEQISSKCKEEFETAGRHAQERAKRCEEATQKVKHTCGTGDQASRMKCYDDHRAELAAICNGKNE